MDQAYRLLRAQCVYCSKFRLSRVEINKYCCKLRLIRHGLLAEAEHLEDIGLKKLDEGDDTDAEDIIEKRLEYVQRCIKKSGGSNKSFDFALSQTEVVGKARRAVIESFTMDIIKSRTCRNCKGFVVETFADPIVD